MRIDGKLSGDFEVKRVRMHDNNKLREAIVVLTTKVKREGAAKIWGDEFVECAFSGLAETSEGQPRWLQGVVDKPKLVCETHTVELNGVSISVQPEIPKITMIEDEAAVIVPLTMRIDLSTKKLAGEIAFATGVLKDVVFDSTQVPVPGSNANAPGAVRTVKGAHGNLRPVRA